MRFHRMLTALAIVLGLAAATAGHAKPLEPFIDLQERGLTLVADSAGLQTWGGGPSDLTVTIGGTVRFALLYWGGRERPCVETPAAGSGDCSGFAEPFKDQAIVFDGTSVTGTVIGTETQPVSAGGPILNLAYFADVTSLVLAKGVGTHTFTLNDGDLSSNLWRLNGASLIVGYIDPASTTTFRVIIWDGSDVAWGPDPTPGETRVTQPANLNHGANPAARTAELWVVMNDCEAARPERIDISNNPSVFNALDSSDGAEWDLEKISVSIPAGVGVTTVQAVSAPLNLNPDSLNWVVAAIRVAQLDAARPTCPTSLVTGPPAQAITTFRDTGSGLAELLVTRSENADTVVPPFTVGTTDPVVVTSTKIDQTQRARIEIRATDLAGNVAICDPIHTLAIRENGKPVALTFSDVPLAESKVTVMNGEPGLGSLEITVNGVKFKANGLATGETRTIDVASAMHEGDNVVTLKANGKPGSQADVFIWDGVGN